MKRLVLGWIFMIGLVAGLHAQTTLDNAVEFTVTDVYNDEHKLSEYLNEGKHVLLYFFFTDCSSCVDALPDLKSVFYHYGSNSGDVAFMGIENGHNNDEVLSFVQKNGINFPTISGNNGGGNQVTGDYDIQTHPTLILIAPDKKILYKDLHPISESALISALSLKGLYPVYPVGEVELESSTPELKVFPNPANNQTQVQFQLSGNEAVSVEVFDVLGARVKLVAHSNPVEGTNLVPVPVGGLPEGHYFLRLLINGKESSVSKLVITH